MHLLAKFFPNHHATTIPQHTRRCWRLPFHPFDRCKGFEAPVQSYAENECRKHIDILVVTHIDEDHISVVIDMLDTYKDDDAFQIDNIWFNSYQSTSSEETRKLLPEETEIILRLKSDLNIS